ncbi:Sec-independent protein translocase protein TatB [Rhodanobacter lindaniclasticus]|jgi:sec-independent protein translocase protein TatB|uniref:Sec-independent protein translocase protein TatB n=1 Tax=Rhodanobacter lindaniclasticus TaxID=75310 RepID=A0A4S3KH34_9GAMM|nr:Sec-independent protein translocase protein TatB [Rhodanobacter lindaniclasticus]THD07992.1 twin arginine-targeting protein translocase TatB [Rhodanobacter lindaniclasticus]
MIEFSLGKLVLLALIALVVLGPEKLPGAARTAGALMRRVRRGWDDVRAEVERELQVEEIRRAAREAAAQAEAAQQQVKDGVGQMREPLAQIVGEVTAAGESLNEPATAAAAEPAEPGPQAELPLGEPTPDRPEAPTRQVAHDDR